MGNRKRKAARWQEAAEKRNREPFFPLRYDVLRSPVIQTLSGNAVKLLAYLMAQYNGYNNGDLSATDKGTAEAGAFKSTATLAKAKRELMESGLIAVSRQGGKNQCTLYALTFLAIDDCGGKLDMGETRRAPDDWKRRHYELNPIPSLKQH